MASSKTQRGLRAQHQHTQELFMCVEMLCVGERGRGAAAVRWKLRQLGFLSRWFFL